jgi:hypothetical protein
MDNINNFPENHPCKHCVNNPANNQNASGLCCCSLPDLWMSNPSAFNSGISKFKSGINLDTSDIVSIENNDMNEDIEIMADEFANNWVNSVDTSNTNQRLKNKIPYFNGTDLSESFVEGAKWILAHQWSDASNDLPCNHPELIDEDNPNYTYDVLCKSEKGTLYVDYMFQSRISKEWKWSTENGFDCKHWMPIPSLPNI